MKPRRIDFYMADWFEGTIGMTCCERGLYITALMAIYSNGGSVSIDDLRARCQREHGHTFNALLRRLLNLGKLIPDDDGKLTNGRCSKELQNIVKRSSKCSQNGTHGNEIKRLANAGRTLSPSPSPEEERKNHSAPESESVAARDHLKVVHDADLLADAAPAEPPDPRSARRRGEYRFEGRIIKLNAADFQAWEKAFHAIPDLEAELVGLDGWFADRPDKQKGWFNATPGMLARKHGEILLAIKQEKQDDDPRKGRMSVGMW